MRFVMRGLRKRRSSRLEPAEHLAWIRVGGAQSRATHPCRAVGPAMLHVMSDTIIRSGRPSDVEAIVAMQRAIHAEHVAWDPARWTTQTAPASVYPDWLGHLLSGTPDGTVIVADVGGTVVGYLLAEVEPESTKHWSPAALYLHDVFVHAAHRRGGVARKLMSALFAWRERAHPELQVRLITAASNDDARAFFSRLGFRACAVELIRE